MNVDYPFNEEVLRHLNYQKDWLKTAVISKNWILSKNGMPMALPYILQIICQHTHYDIMS